MAKEIWDALAMKRALTRITYEIIEQNKGTDDLVLVGIKTRGVYLAKRIHDRIQKLEGVDVPVGELDITLYRDDRHDASLKQDPVVNSDQVDVNIDDKHVVLVDDVIYTGRTIRAAMDALMHVGRPSSTESLPSFSITLTATCSSAEVGIFLPTKSARIGNSR